jgi:DNA-binding NtrC family response regulator
VAVYCGALSETLLDDELFGHEKGAYTGAHTGRKGLIPAAEKGTVFLDEVDGLSPRAQVSLLRLLQEKTYRALGSADELKADVRIIAATNSDLTRCIASGLFRQDLFYRLCVFRFHLPPLRERTEDIHLLAEHFLRKHAPESGRILRFEESARQMLNLYSWPGNVRELENCVIRAVHLATEGVIEGSDLGLPFDAPEDEPAGGAALGSFQEMKRLAVERFEREYLTRLMAESGGNVTQAARAAGKERRELGKLLKKYSLQPKRCPPGIESGPPPRVKSVSAG